MKKILIVAAAQSSRPTAMANRSAFADELTRQIKPSTIVDMTSLTNMIFDISNDKCSVIDKISGNDVADYDLVIIRTVGKRLEIGIALAQYLTMKQVPFIDGYLKTQGAGKLTCQILKRRYNLSTPRTVYATKKHLSEYINNTGALTYPFVLKADKGKKGRDNYLVKSPQELNERLSAQPDVTFIAQEYIENDGDYRVLVMGGKISVVIKRMASSDTHLNNISQGGLAELASIDVFSPDVQTDILTAARIELLEVAGVDVVFDKKSSKYYLLEVNRAPQINTGAFTAEKITAYADMISDKIMAI